MATIGSNSVFIKPANTYQPINGVDYYNAPITSMNIKTAYTGEKLCGGAPQPAIVFEMSDKELKYWVYASMSARDAEYAQVIAF